MRAAQAAGGPLALLTVLAVLAAAAATPDITAEAERLRDVLELQPGATVADIGAGSGEMSVALAKVLGPSSRAYATDINQAGRLVSGARSRSVSRRDHMNHLRRDIGYAFRAFRRAPLAALTISL